MLDENCIFCKIISAKNPDQEVVKETKNILVIKDLHPKAPYHYLIIPKKHIVNLNSLEEQDFYYISDIVKMAKQLANEIKEKENLENPAAFNLITNNGADAGQSVFHMHWHFLSGKDIYKGEIKL